jgi:NADH-quinone oxidoreductase subunit E
MARFTTDNVERARETISRYPASRSALLPLLYLAQEQDGWVDDDAMRHIAELLDLTPAAVLGTCSFYTMFKREPVGRHLVSVCTNIACLLNGGLELLEHAEERLGIVHGETTVDGEFTLEEVECLADCDRAPCLQVNYRFFGNVTDAEFDQLVDDLRAGRLRETVPVHGVLNRESPPPVAVRHADTPHGAED